MELFPYDPVEDKNPKIKLYNEIGRHIADFNMDYVSIPKGISLEEAKRITWFVMFDYPEFFWTGGIQWSGDSSIRALFCCLKSDTEFDMAMIKRYREEIRRSAAPFLKGITRKTSPYQAVLTIYRRVIKSFDYDDLRLAEQQKNGKDMHNEDLVRSLHSALTSKKVVCAGYAVAMQYLLQSVGICCGYVSSTTHAWNAVKLGKSCYFLDATWGDASKTSQDRNDDTIYFDYFCVTSDENPLGGTKREGRTPDPALFYDLEPFRSTKHNFYRHEQCYLTAYDEEALVQAFAKQILAGDPTVTFRCSSATVLRCVCAELFGNGRIEVILSKVREEVAQKNRKLGKRISGYRDIGGNATFNTYYLSLLGK